LVPIYFFLAASKLDPADLVGLIPFYAVGVLCNLAAAVIQYSLSSGVSLSDFLGYSAMVGMFANVNHFTTVMFSSIPVVLYLGIFMGQRAFAAISMILIFLVLLASGSMAGILIGFFIAIVSLASLAWRVRVGGILVLVLTVALAVYSYGAINQIGAQVIDPEYGRRYFALTTLQAIQDNWLFGVGYGAFDMVFPHYEPSDAIHAYFVNHVHNDYLEIVLEGGMVGAILLGIYAVAVLWQAFRAAGHPLQRLALLSILMVLMHSTVDYPLRTMAVALVFAFFNALLFSDVKTTLVRRKSRQKEEYLPAMEEQGEVDNKHAFVDL
jgi:O-antigen ligase